MPTLEGDYQAAPTRCSAQVAAGCNTVSPSRLLPPSAEIDGEVRSQSGPEGLVRRSRLTPV